MNDIYDIKPALEMGRDWGWLVWALVALFAALAGLLAVWLYHRRRKNKTEPAPEPTVSPEAAALAALDRLTCDGNTDGKQFYFTLSAILRRYVEQRYTIPAEEMTVEELLPQVDRLSLDQDLCDRFKSLCRHCEPIKFADAPAEIRQMPQDLEFAREFVQRTTPKKTDEGGE